MQSIFEKLIFSQDTKFVLSFILILVILLGCGKSSEKKNPKPGFDFDLPDLNGKIVSLDDFRGKVVIINFWATWCPPCEEEIPKLNQLHKRYENEALVVIGIALDKDSLNLVEPFVRKKRVGYPTLVGNEQVLRGVKDFSGVPTTLIVDQKGKIQKKFDGSFDKDDLERSLKELLY
jgi:cytochrome c biogenesis protein CcmG/thiol:disulfide interchange protein DsbE